MTTLLEVVESALARAMDWRAEFPTSKRPMYRRITVRQQHLFSLASQIDPEFYGAQASGPLDGNRSLDLADLPNTPLVDQAVGLQRVVIEDIGTSSYTAGQRVNLVSIDDVLADLPPRMTYRDRVLRAVGTDMDGVTSVCIYYPRAPALAAAAEDGTTVVSLADPYTELLVIDLAVWLARKTLKFDGRETIITELIKEEAAHIVLYEDDVRSADRGRSTRWSEPLSPVNK